VAHRQLIRLRARYRLTPWWVRVLAVYAASRVVTTLILLAYAAAQPANPWTGASPGYADFATMWDGHWYFIIAVAGYPSDLPITDSGAIGENAWAFMPVYPLLVRALMLLTGLPFDVLAVAVSVCAGAGAALVFERLMRLVLPPHAVMFSVVLFCVAPLSPILQVAYAESLHLLLLVTALYLLVRRRYVWMLPVIAVASLTRPSGLALALALTVHVVVRWVRRRRDAFPPGEVAAAAGVAVFSGVMGLVWPAMAWLSTGRLTAYTDTELAWRAPYVGEQHLVPFAAWPQAAQWWFGRLGLAGDSPVGVLVLLLVVALFAAALFTPPVRRLGVDLRIWVGSYALYLLAVFFPQSSTFRLLVPLFPLLGVVALPRSPWYRIAAVAVAIAGQVGWVHIAWWVDGYDWTPP